MTESTSRWPRFVFLLIPKFTGFVSRLSAAKPQASVRLIGGIAAFQGAVQLELYGRTGSVCDDGFGNTEADVLCRMMGYNRYAYKRAAS